MSPKRTGMHFLFCFVDLALIAPNIRWIRRFSAAAQHLIMVHFNLSPLYGSNGVPSDKFYFAMNHFCDDGGMIGLSMFHNMNIDSNSRNKYVIVINAVHAVNLEYKSGSSIMYYDAQNGVRGFCTLPNVTHVYEIR